MTRWGIGSGHDWPSALTCCSSMVSRRAACVRGGVLFSSSTRTTWAKTRSDDQMGDRQRPRLAVGAHLLLLHGLEEGRLRARWGPVQLVDENDVGEDQI